MSALGESRTARGRRGRGCDELKLNKIKENHSMHEYVDAQIQYHSMAPEKKSKKLKFKIFLRFLLF